LLTVLGILSYKGVDGIVDNASEVIEGSKRDALPAQKEFDHMNWAAKVNALLTDDGVTTLDVVLDHKECSFGRWLYGPGRKDKVIRQSAADTEESASAAEQLSAQAEMMRPAARDLKEIIREKSSVKKENNTNNLLPNTSQSRLKTTLPVGR
jgi:methyl-accepting chemotaxis protein